MDEARATYDLVSSDTVQDEVLLRNGRTTLVEAVVEVFQPSKSPDAALAEGMASCTISYTTHDPWVDAYAGVYWANAKTKLYVSSGCPNVVSFYNKLWEDDLWWRLRVRPNQDRRNR